jgi:hypothetical protein
VFINILIDLHIKKVSVNKKQLEKIDFFINPIFEFEIKNNIKKESKIIFQTEYFILDFCSSVNYVYILQMHAYKRRCWNR